MPSPKRLPPLPTISDIIKLYGLSARSQLSQNFLLGSNVTDRIVRVAGNLRDCCVCEVGPGPGSLTRSIINAGPRKLVAVEKDRRFLPSLELLQDASGGCFEVHLGDALEFDIESMCAPHVDARMNWEDDPPKFHIIGNLPFNISIPLLLRWLAMIPQRRGPFSFGRSQLTLTFQKEVAERIMAPPNHIQRSRLSIMTQHLCNIKRGFLIKGSSFVPPPKGMLYSAHACPKHCPRVRHLNLKRCFQVSESGLISLAKHCKQLQEISIYRCYGVTDRAIKALLHGCRQLRVLDLGYCYKVTDSSLRCLHEQAPRLELLGVHGCPEVSDIVMRSLCEAGVVVNNISSLGLSAEL